MGRVCFFYVFVFGGFSMWDAGKRDFGSEGSRNAGGAGAHGAGSWYAAPGITKPASLTS